MEPPSFSTTGPQVVRAAPGSDADLVLPLPSGSPPFHYEWSRAGAKLDDRFKPTDGAGGVHLTISAVSTGDSGVYTLQASNAAGKDTTQVRLEVSPDEKPTGEDPPTFLRRLQDLTVKVGTRTRFLVEIVSSTECRVTWYRNERRLLEAERIALVRDGNFWCADISAVSVDDAGRWTCTAENLGGRASCSAHLNVLVPKAYKRPEFVEELRALLTEEGTVSLECKVVGVPTPVLRWFKDSREIKAGDVFALTANAEDPTSLGTYTCEAVNCMGRAYSSSKVHVIGRASTEGSMRSTSGGHVALEPPPIFTKELEDQFVRICEPLTLSCNIVVPPWPRTIVWYNKEGKIEPSEKYRVLEDGVGGYLVEVPSAEWPDEGEWKCVATSSAGRIGITTCYVSMDAPKNYRKPRFMENLQAVLTEEGLVSFECKVVGFPTPVLSWFKDGQELKPGDVYQLTGTNSLGSYCCIARNCMGQASSSAELTVEDIQNQLNEEEKLQLFSKNQAPKFLQGLKSVEAKIDEPFRFTIKVAIPPEPTVLWYRDDQPVDESSRCHHGKEERGVFFLDIQSLEFMDQAEWKCVAMNDFGHSVTSCFLKLIIPRHYKKPRFLENLQAILSDEGAVNLECKVIGVPQPVLKWYKDGEELKPGDIHRIISGQDGTCCLGTYTCEAQNCMGIAASSASLLGFEDSIKTKGKKKEDEQTLQRNLSLSTIHEERTSQMYDTPVGDITLDDKGEISFSFDGKEVSVSLYETPDLTEEEALQIVEMYADQLSENVTEHNVVELPPLRFVKETSTSGNLLMEAIIIDVSPEYFTSPEEDLRTEADVEDISIADENGPPQLSLDQEVDGEDYLEKTMVLLSDEKANFPKKTDRKKSDSQKSADDYFSLSRDQSLSEEKKDDDTRALSESDLQSFASAHSSGKVKSKSSKPSIEDGLESSDITKTVLLKEDLQTMRQQNETDLVMKNKRERRSRSSRRSSSGSEISLNEMREDVLDDNYANTRVATNLDQERTKTEIDTVKSTVTKLINDVQVIERDIILKSELMSTAATASRSLEIINSFITPLSEIHSIAEVIKESINGSLEITTSLFNRLLQPLSIFHQSLTIVEKCIDLQSENKTLVKKTCTNIIEKCAGDIKKLAININSIVEKDCPFIEDTCVSSIQTTNNEILNTITCSVAAIKEYKEVSEKLDLKLDKKTLELKHLQKTQKAVYELRNPLQSLLHIAEGVDISGSISLENVAHTQIILNDMSAPIQALQTALEQIELLSVTETQSGLKKYNTEIMETVMDSVIKLRTSFEQLSVEAETMVNVEVLETILVDVKRNINEISTHLDAIEVKIGPFDVLQSDNKLEALQKMAQILINLENNLVILDIVPCIKMHMANFHKNLTKVLEHVIESNEATKYLSLLEICDGIYRLNSFIKNIDANDILSLAGISNNLRIIQANIKKNEFTSDLNLSINANITDLLLDINETMNHADTSTFCMVSENLQDISVKHYEEGKLNIVLEQIEKAISTVSTVVSLESTKDLDIKQTFKNIIPTLEEIKCCVASLTENVNEKEENISDISNFTFTQTVANPLCELNRGISVINQMICEKALDYCENEIKVELVTPLLEIRNALEILQQDVISQNGENINSLSIISSVANAVQSVQSCIIMIQQQDLLQNADELSTLDDISAIKTSADILSSDHLLSPSVNEITTEIDTQALTEFETQIVTSVSAQILRNLNDHIMILQRPEIVETLNQLSKHDEYSSIKSITTGINTIHCAIGDILHPVRLGENPKLSYFVSPTQLSTIIQPVQELHDYLSVFDINNMLVKGIIKTDETKCLSQYLSKLEHCLRDSIDYLNVAIETTDVTLEISTQIEILRKLCVELKDNLHIAKNDNIIDSSELIILNDSLTTVLDTTNCYQEINIIRLKLSIERLQQNIASVQDEILGFTVDNPVVLHHETKILKLVADIEKTIASLAVLQFIDIDQISDFDFFNSQQVSKEVNNGQSKKIENIVETLENCIQQLPLDMPNKNNIMSVKNFVKIFNDEITLLSCIFNQKPTPKRIIKMLQLFYDLNENLKQYQLNQEMSGTSADSIFGIATLEECLQNVQALLLEVLDTHNNLVFNIPISNITNDEIILNEILESNKNASLHHFVKLLMNTIELIKPCFEYIHTDVVQELKSRDINLSIDDDDTDKNFALLYKYLSEKTESKNIEGELDFSAIFRVIQKYADCKHIRGTGKKVIYIKCMSECLNLLKQTLNDLENKKQVLKAESTSLNHYELKRLLIELSGPFEIFCKKFLNICNENLQITDKSNILKDIELLESQEEAINMAKVLDKLLKCENLVIGNFSDSSTKTLAKDFVSKIHSIEKSLKNLESARSVQMIMSIQPLKEIEKILTCLLTEEVIREEDRQSREKTSSLLQHMEQYIEIIQIVEEVSAVIKFDEFKKSADIVRELRDSITSEKYPDIHLTDSELNIREEQTHLVQNLQKSLTTLQNDALEFEQELLPFISDDIRQHIIEVVFDLQNDLIALTNTPVVCENYSELSENVKPIDQNYLTLIQEEKNIASPLEHIQNEQLSIIISEGNPEESLNVICTDLTCDLPRIMEIEETLPHVEVSSDTSLEIFDEKLSLELKSDTELITSNIQDLSAIKFHQIKESLIHHINDYLSQDIIEYIKKLLPCQNFEQLEQSLRIAIEVRDNSVSEDSDPLAQQVFLKRQLGLVLNLQEVMLRIHSKNLYDVNDDLLQSVIENKSLLTAKSVVQNLLNSLQMYLANAEVLIDESKIISKQTCKENVSNSTIAELKICDEDISLKEDPVLSILIENQKSVQEFRQGTDTCTIFEGNNNLNDLNMLPEDISIIPSSVGNEHVNDESKIDTAPTLKVIFGEQKLGEKTLKSYPSDSESSESLNFATTIKNIPDINIFDSLNVQEETEWKINDNVHLNEGNILLDDNVRLNEGNILLNSNTFNDTEIVEVIPANTNTDKEKSNAVLELETLLQEVNEALNFSENYPVIHNSEGLQDLLEEVQTTILKLKCDFDGSTNDTLNENIEDLECNVRSVQLQINENCPPALLKEACANLQTLAACINNVCNAQSTFSTENNALRACTDDAKQALELLDEVSSLKVDINLDNIILNLNSIKVTMKSLKSCFMDDADALILRGIEVLQHLNQIEDKIFVLENELEANNEIDVIFRDSIIAATHSIYGSISNMRGNLCSIQKKYMYDNYGKPTDNFLKSIKNLNVILRYDKNDDWKKFAKSLHTILKHFEDIKFYINFDKTARLPSDSAFSKIILSDLSNMLSVVVLQITKDLDMNLTGQIQDALDYVSGTLNNMENRTTLEVKEKIPIFRELSIKMYDITDEIKILLKKRIDNISEPSKANEELSDQEESIVNIPLCKVKYIEKDAQKVDELKREQQYIKGSDIRKTESYDGTIDINQNQNEVNTISQKENEISTLESSIDGIVTSQNDNEINEVFQNKMQNVVNEHLNIDIVDKEIETQLTHTITTDTGNIESGYMKATDGIQNIVGEITIFDSAVKNILVSKEEKTNNKGIFEKVNVFDENSTVSGSSFTDISIKHVIDTIQESVEKETQKTNLETENISDEKIATMTTNTGNIKSGYMKSTDGIQNIVDEITMFETADKNILINKKEETKYNTGIIEKVNVLDENTIVSGSSLSDIGIKRVIDTAQESVEKETQKTNLEAENISDEKIATTTMDTGNIKPGYMKATDGIQTIVDEITIFDTADKNILVSKEEETNNTGIIEKVNVLDEKTIVSGSSLTDIGIKRVIDTMQESVEKETQKTNLETENISDGKIAIITTDTGKIEPGYVKATDGIQNIVDEITIFDTADKNILVSKEEKMYNKGIIEKVNVLDENTIVSGSSLIDIGIKRVIDTMQESVEKETQKTNLETENISDGKIAIITTDTGKIEPGYVKATDGIQNIVGEITIFDSADKNILVSKEEETNNTGIIEKENVFGENTIVSGSSLPDIGIKRVIDTMQESVEKETQKQNIQTENISDGKIATITTDTGNIEPGYMKATDGIQNIVDEITIFDTADKNILVSKEEKTNNTGIIENENVFGENTIVSGSSLTDIGIKHVIDTLQESVAKETPKINLETENISDEKIATITTDTGNIKTGYMKATGGIQNIVDEITIFDADDKNILVSKEEEINNKGIIEKVNVLDENTIVSGSSLTDIGIKYVIETIHESVKKETQKTENTSDEKIATAYSNQHEYNNFPSKKQEEESEKFVPGDSKTEHDNIISGIGMKNTRNNNTSEESVKIQTENKMKTFETNENKEQFGEDSSSSILEKQFQIDNLTLNKQKEESEEQLHIYTRKQRETNEIKSEDIINYKNQLVGDTKIQSEEETLRKKIKANITVKTKNEIDTDIQIDYHEFTSKSGSQVGGQMNEKGEQTAASVFDSVETESLNLEKPKEEPSTTTAKQLTPQDCKSDIAVPLKQQKYDKTISLDSLQYSEQKYNDILDIETKINVDSGENTGEIQQYQEQELDVESKVESFKVEKDLLIETLTEPKSIKFDNKFAESQEVLVSISENIQSMTEFNDDPKRETSENNTYVIGLSESIYPKIIDMKEDDVQERAKELDMNDKKIFEGEEIRKANVDINVVKDGHKSQVDINIVEYEKSTPLNSFEDNKKEECSINKKTRQSDIIIKLEEEPLSIHTPKMVEIAQNIKTENEGEMFSPKPQKNEKSKIKNEQCLESHIKQFEPTEKKLEDDTKKDNEISNDNKKQYNSILQKTLMDTENITRERKINQCKIIRDVDEALDLLHKSTVEDTVQTFGNLKEIQKNELSIEICESQNRIEQDIEDITSKEILYVDENVISDKIILESKDSDMTGSNQRQITKIIKEEKENENHLTSAYDEPKDKSYEEHFEEREPILSSLTYYDEKNLHDTPIEIGSKTKNTVQEEIELKQPMKTIQIDDLTEVTLLGNPSESVDLKSEKEHICEEDFKEKIHTEPNIKLKIEKAEMEVILPSTVCMKEIDSNVLNQTINVSKDNKDVIDIKQKTESMNEEQGQPQEPLEIIENVDMPDIKYEKQDDKPKLKVKKSIECRDDEKRHLKKLEEANSQSLENSQKSKTRNGSKELIQKKEEVEQQYRKDMITKENGNNNKSVNNLGEPNKVEGDKNNEQNSHQTFPKEIFLHETTKEKGASAALKNQEQIEPQQNIPEQILLDESTKAKEAAAVHLRDYQQQKKIEEEKKDEPKIEKKNTDKNQEDQMLIGKENIYNKSEKELRVIHLIETGTLNTQMDVQEDKQQGEEERTIKNSNYSQQKMIDTGKIDKEIQISNKEILSINKANEFELLKPGKSSSDKNISLIEEGTGLKELQKNETNLTEFQEDEKQTLVEDYSFDGQSAYNSDELLGTVEEKNAKNSAGIHQNKILSKNEKKLNSQVNKHKENRQPSFIDRSELDYGYEFARPPAYTTKSFDIDKSPMEIKTTSKSPTIYRAQTLIHESQLKSSLLPYIDQRSNISERRSEHKQRSNTTSDSRSTMSDKRGSYPRVFQRKPVFSTYLTDRTAVQSSRVKLTCSVLSSTDPEISWYKNGVLLDNKHKCRIKCVDGLITLEILNAVPSDSGEYSCTVKNENGSVTSSANLKVYPSFEASPIPPTFTRSIRDFYHLHENELVLECRIRGQPLPTITWLKDNMPIILNERYQTYYLADGVCRLTILSPNEDDSGKYTCKAENSMWSDQITHEVYFTSKENRHIRHITTSENIRFTRQATESRRPHFTNILSDHKVVSGGTIGLQVEISGSPTRVEWLREGLPVTETYSNAQTYIDRGLYTLALSDVTEKESGLYTCRAWSTKGPVEMNASITVVQPNQFDGKPATIISRPAKDLLISVGEDLNISFRVQGEPKTKVFLMKGIRDITNSQRVCKMTSDDYVKFTLKRSVISDAGTYCVFVRNAYGCDRAFITVVIRQRASSEHLISDWTYPMDDLAISVVDRNYQSVPDRIPSEPSTVDGGNNWVSLAWPKPVSQVKAPILAYKVESWLLGKEGGARWIELGITPRNCFDAFNLKQGEEYHFRVTPRNRYGWGESVQTSTPIGIGLAGDRPEFIEILPGQLKVLVGETATLCCSFKGNPMPAIVWMKNGHEVEEETERVIVQLNDNNTSLQINDIKIEDEGRYSCEATNVHGRSSTYSRMAVITDRQIWAADAKLKRERSAGANGEYPPQFTMRLRDRRVQATYPVRLTCQVIGSPSPLVTWFKDGEEVSVGSRHTTFKDGYFYTLEIAPTTLDDGGVYEAMARNGSGAISCRCNLVVDKGIRAYIAPEFCCGFEPLYRICEGDELRISAVVEAYPSVGVTWYRDGVRLRPSRRAIMTLDRDGQIELALASIAARDAGVYTCTASNEVGRASTSGKVEVVKGEQKSETLKVPPIVVSPDLPYSKEPMFIKKPRSSEAREGDTVIIECEVIGDPKPEVYWLRDFLKPDYYRDASHFKRIGAGPAYQFEIPHAKFDYTGAYSIVAKNVHGEAKAIISLQILAKDSTCSDDTHNIRYGRVEVIPRFEKELTDLLCYDGDAIEFECRVSGNPEPDIRWFHYSEVLPECRDFETSYALRTARLKIKHVTAEDEGTYFCEASNNLGKATSSACLVIYPPGEPNTLSQRLRRPPALLSASSTPRSTPRTTPARSLSRTPGPDLKRLCSPSREIAPKFYTYPYNRVVEEGDTVVFQCAVKGLPPPWATWDKDGIIITPTARISIREKDDMFRILEIEQVTIEDVGLYRVTLENDYGRAEASARLEVISQTGKFYGSRSYSVSPRKCLPYRRRTLSLTRQD